MSDHSQISDYLPLYVSGALDSGQRLAVEKHLSGCAECQSDLALWQLTAVEIEAGDRHAIGINAAGINAAGIIAAGIIAADPRKMSQQVLRHVRLSSRRPAGNTPKLAQFGQLIRSQMPLVNREIWPASAGVIALGYIIAVMAAQSGFVYALAPLIAAACVSLIIGPENDPAFELALATPTSPRQILLARLVLVFGYNLALVLVATLGLLPFAPLPLTSSLVLTWLAPMTFLSAAALLLSLWIGPSNAISITYVAWLAQIISGPLRGQQMGAGVAPAVAELMDGYLAFWQTPLLLLALSAALFAAAVWLAGRQTYSVPRSA